MVARFYFDRISLGITLGFALLMALASTRLLAEDLMIGTAKIDLTPDVKASKVPLGGYASRKGATATGVLDRVYARVVTLTKGNQRVCIASLDLCFLPASLVGMVREKLEQVKPEWKGATLFLSATHTHSAPDPLAMHSANRFKLSGWTSFDAKLAEFTAQKTADAILDALSRQVKAKVGTLQFDNPGMNRNRRGEAKTDNTISLVKIADQNNKPLAVLVNYAAHPTLLEDRSFDVSGDWCGVFTAAMETELGAGAVCLFLNGAEGDVSPAGVDDIKGAERIQVYGQNLKRVVWQPLEKLTADSTELRGWTETVKLPQRKPNALFVAAAAQMGASFAQAKELVNALMPEETPLTFVRIGNALLIGMGCEPTTELGLRAKELAHKAGYPHPCVVALTNDWLAYALMPEEYRKGNYEAMMSFYGDTLGTVLLDGVKKGLTPAK